ncbi:MAG TPA: hypothetical protein VIX89_07325 [Bryobacteraceae bacterium]
MNKYEDDSGLRLDRTLYSPVHYPGDYGFIPGDFGGRWRSGGCASSTCGARSSTSSPYIRSG